MAYSLGDIVVKLKADTADLDRGLASAQTKTSGFAKGLSKIGAGLKVLGVGLAVGGAAATALGVVSVKAYNESEAALTQLNAVLKSTKGVAGVTAKSADELAKSLQKVTKFSDEQVLSAENMLLTFTKIGKDVFPQATETVLDMSQALGQDLKSSSIQLGKALQDPVRGVMALRRVGVNFTADQVEVIKKMVETGKQAEAQKYILKELQTEFGGSARAAGQTFAGSLTILKNQINDVQESLGKAIVQGITPFIKKAAEWASSIDWENVISRTQHALSTFWNQYLVPFGNAVINVAQQVAQYLEPKFEALWHSLNEKLIPALMNLWKNVIEPMMPVIGTLLVAAIGFAIDAINLLIQAISPLINWLGQNKGAVYALIGAITAWYVLMKANAAFTAIYNSLAILRASLFATQTQVGGVRGAVQLLNSSLAGFTGWGIFAAAAVAAFVLIKNKANETINTLNQTAAAVDQNYNSFNSSIQQLQNLAKNGTPAQKARAKAAIAKGVAGLPHKATGGAVNAGMPYIVGENGQELFVPSKNGTIIPNHALGKGVDIHGDVNIGSMPDADYFFDKFVNRDNELTSLGVSPAS